MEKEFTAEQMIEFANWYGEVDEEDLQRYRDTLKEKAEREYQLFLTLKEKYEKK